MRKFPNLKRKIYMKKGNILQKMKYYKNLLEDYFK